MKKLIAVSIFVMLLFSSTSSAIECNGTVEEGFEPGQSFGLCWGMVDEPEVTGYYVYRSTVSNELGTHVTTTYQTNCDTVTQVCHIPDMVSPLEPGPYFYKVVAYVGPRTVTYEKYDEVSGEMVTHSYEAEPYQSRPSNEAVGITVAGTKPSRPPGCAILRGL